MPLGRLHLLLRKASVQHTGKNKQSGIARQHANYFFPGGTKMGNESDLEKGCGFQQAGNGSSFLALRSLTQLIFAVWPLMRLETMRGTSM